MVVEEVAAEFRDDVNEPAVGWELDWLVVFVHQHDDVLQFFVSTVDQLDVKSIGHVVIEHSFDVRFFADRAEVPWHG